MGTSDVAEVFTFLLLFVILPVLTQTFLDLSRNPMNLTTRIYILGM